MEENQLEDDKLDNIFYTTIKYIADNDKLEGKYRTVFTLLLRKGIDINVPDILSGWTTIYAAAYFRFKEIIKCILEEKCGEIDFDNFIDKIKKSALDLIKENSLYENMDYIDKMDKYTYSNDIHTLYKYIRNREILSFLEKLDILISNNSLKDKHKYWLFYLATEKKLLTYSL